MNVDGRWPLEDPFDLMSRPPSIGTEIDPSGEKIEVFLRIRNERIVDMSSKTNGSDIVYACTLMLEQKAKGKTLAEASIIDEEELIEALGGLSVKHRHCARAVINAFKKAIQNHRS